MEVQKMAETNGFFNSEALVSTDWAAEHGRDQGVRLVEVDVDTSAYERGHIEGAVAWDWRKDLQDQTVRDLAPKEALERVLSRSGITPATTILLYGDNNNWFAAYAYWALKYYGHDKAKLINGGRVKLEAERRELTTDVPRYDETQYRFQREPQEEFRAYRDEVLRKLGQIG